MYSFLIDKIKLKFLNRRWKRINCNNSTFLQKRCNIDIISVGIGTYGPLCVESWSANNEGLIIGNYCSISVGVKFLLGGNHNYNTISSYPFKVMMFKTESEEAFSKGKIIIEDDVWIGMDVTILSGVRVGKGSVIGTGSVVAKDIEPYSIVVGNPAKIIKKRFNDEVIDYLLQQDFSLIDFDQIAIEHLYSSINNVEDASSVLYGK